MDEQQSPRTGDAPGNDQIVRVNGVDLRVETFGDPAHPAVLLLIGPGASTDRWEAEFCERLATGSRYVIRYHHRDTGRSVSHQPDTPRHALDDLVADAVGVLDGLGLANAHLVDLSTGGVIGQLMALDQPDRVASLTLIGTSPDPGEPDLPALSAVPTILRRTSGGWNQQANRLAADSLAAGDPTGWFERLYAEARLGQVAMPWDRGEPRPALAAWARERQLTGAGRRALVVGCGLGADAEYLAELGFDTVAFDIAESAIEIARSRFPDSPVRYRTADVLDPPAEWVRAFDFVLEIYTVQALPDPPRRQAIANVAEMVGPGGTLLVIAAARDAADRPYPGPPWPLARTEIEAFAAGGLTPVRIEDTRDPDDPAVRRWRAEFHRPGGRGVPPGG